MSSYFSRCEIKGSDPPGIYYFNKNNDVYAQALESENQHKPVKVLNRCLFKDIKDQEESLWAKLENCHLHTPILYLSHSQCYIYRQIASIQAVMANSPDDFSALNNYFIQKGVSLDSDADSRIWNRWQIDLDEYFEPPEGCNITDTSVSQLHDDFLSQFSLQKIEKKSPARVLLNLERSLSSKASSFDEETKYLLEKGICEFYTFFMIEFNRSMLMSRPEPYQYLELCRFIASAGMNVLKQQTCC